MQYCSPVYYLLFLPFVGGFYYICPKKKRWVILLLASYLFFMSISRHLIVYLLFSTLSIYFIGLMLEKLQIQRDQAVKERERKERKEIKKQYKKKQLQLVVLGVILQIGLLIILKYSDFLGTNVNQIFHLSLPIYTFMVPIGISFYSLQAVSYIIDVYHEKIVADHHLGRVALYMSFFPSLMEGPICRYEQTAQALFSGSRLDWQNIRFGLQRILYGLIKKMVIADRLNILITTVFKDYGKFDGGIIALAMVCYTCQLYMEFSGTIDVVIGSGKIFGITMPENFKQPFFSKSISEFWSRWHITLGTWFKDYIYYPMSLSSSLRTLTKKARKYVGNYYGPLLSGTIALFCVWFCNGIWHGDAWNYIFFGMYHFSLIFLGNIFAPLVSKMYEFTHISKDCFVVKVLRMFKTAILVCIGELFFRAPGLKAGIKMFTQMVTQFSLASFSDGKFLTLGVDDKDFLIVLVTCLLVFVISVLKEKGVHICSTIEKKNIVLRWTVWYVLIFYLIIFGAYGIGYIPVDPIYAGF